MTKINCPKEWESNDDWDSHKPMLWLALENTNDEVVELGCGFGSTPLLKEYCLNNNREFVTYETNKDWAEKVDSVHTDNYFKELGKNDLVFIDCAPGEIRKDLIEYYADMVGVIVTHDVEVGAEYVYGMANILSTFKYRIDYNPQGKPQTAIVSNKIDVTKWAE